MKDDSETLDEVVVVGYGTMRKKDLTGSVVQVRPDKIANENPKTVQDILRGTPGLVVGYGEGDAGAKGGGEMKIRGQRSVYTDGCLLYTSSNCRKIWTGTLGSELLLITSIIKIIIWDNGVVGMILVWVHWATGEHISSTRLTNSWNWDCHTKSLCNTQMDIMIISSHILPRFSSVSRNVKECHR